MSSSQPQYQPFYDPVIGEQRLTYPAKALIAIGIGSLYILLSWWVMPDKLPYFEQKTWILGVIISTAIFALYIATDVFRQNLVIIAELEQNSGISRRILNSWLSDQTYLIGGLLWGLVNAGVASGLGIPPELTPTGLSTSMLYAGYFLGGFTGGMGMLAVTGIILLYLKFAPLLQHALDETDPEGIEGFKKLGDYLWLFAALIACVGMLICGYLFGVDWQNLHSPAALWTFSLWAALPFILSVSIVLVPGLAVRREVGQFKDYRQGQLKRQRASLYNSLKDFESGDDETIIETKREIADKIARIQQQMDKLREMPSSHLDK